MLKTETHKECEDHQNYQIRYICMEQLCKDNSLCCIMCIKHSHKKCDEQLFVDIEEIDKRIEIEESGQVEELKKNIEDIFKEEYEIFFENLKKKKDFILKGFEEPKRDLKNLTAEDILNYKQFFEISKNEKKNRICVKNPIKYDEKHSKEDIKEFESDLKQKMKTGSNFVSELKFYNTSKLLPSFFQTHQSLITTQNYNGVKIKKSEKSEIQNKSTNYFIFSKKPLDSIKLKFTMNKKYQKIPFIGLVPEGVLKKLKKTKENKKWGIYEIKDRVGVQNDFFSMIGEGNPRNLTRYQIDRKTKVREDFDVFSLFFEYDRLKQNLSVYSDGNELSAVNSDLPVKRVYHLLILMQGKEDDFDFEFDLEKLC